MTAAPYAYDSVKSKSITLSGLTHFQL